MQKLSSDGSIKFLRYWLPLLVWLGVIFFGSTDLMSAEHTSRFIVPFLRWLKSDISIETLASIHFVIRKCAHLSEYAILALLLLRASIYVINFKCSMPTLYVCVWVTLLSCCYYRRISPDVCRVAQRLRHGYSDR